MLYTSMHIARCSAIKQWKYIVATDTVARKNTSMILQCKVHKHVKGPFSHACEGDMHVHI